MGQEEDGVREEDRRSVTSRRVQAWEAGERLQHVVHVEAQEEQVVAGWGWGFPVPNLNR